MKTTNIMISLLCVGLLTANCGGEVISGDSLGKKLTSQTSFLLSADNFAEIIGDCGSDTASDNSVPNTAALTADGEDGQVDPEPASNESSSEDLTVYFTATQFTLKSGTVTRLKGTWQEIDSNTIQVTIDGETLELNVTLDEDTIILSLPAGTNLDCSSATDNTATADSMNSRPGEAMTEPVLSSVFVGTWCHVSGYQEPSLTDEESNGSAGGTITAFVFRDFNSSGYLNVDDAYYNTMEIQGKYLGYIEDMTQQDEHTLVDLKYYNPNSEGSWANLLEFSGNNLTVTYGNFNDAEVGIALFERVSDKAIACPGSLQ